nr:hypothetical protein [Achromobacter sp. AONIH1]
MTIKPRFCVALIALALAGGSAGPSFAQSMSGGGAANPNASRTTLDPIPPKAAGKAWPTCSRPSNPASTPA